MGRDGTGQSGAGQDGTGHLNLTFKVTCDWQLSQFLRCFYHDLPGDYLGFHLSCLWSLVETVRNLKILYYKCIMRRKKVKNSG